MSSWNTLIAIDYCNFKNMTTIKARGLNEKDQFAVQKKIEED